jgi:hypothetical protein
MDVAGIGDVNGWGLLSRHGIKKPSYHAYALLHAAGEWRLPMNGSIKSGSTLGGYALTNDHPTQSTLTIFVYNYDDPTKPWKSQVYHSCFIFILYARIAYVI